MWYRLVSRELIDDCSCVSMMRIRMMVSAMPLLQSFVLYMKQLILLTHRSDENLKKNRRHFYNLNLSSSKCVILQSFSLNDDDDDDGYEYPESIQNGIYLSGLQKLLVHHTIAYARHSK